VIDAGDTAFYSSGNNKPYMKSQCVGVYKRFHICNDQVGDGGTQNTASKLSIVETVTINLYAVYNVLCAIEKFIVIQMIKKSLLFMKHMHAYDFV
jgi:hypothetical protein